MLMRLFARGVLYGLLLVVVAGFLIINNRFPELPPGHAQVVPGKTRVGEVEALYGRSLPRSDACVWSTLYTCVDGPWPSTRRLWIEYEFRGPNTHYPSGITLDDRASIITRINQEEGFPGRYPLGWWGSVAEAGMRTCTFRSQP